MPKGSYVCKEGCTCSRHSCKAGCTCKKHNPEPKQYVAPCLDGTLRGEGAYLTVEHRAWRKMLNRCYDPNDKSWRDYGGRGIAVCKEWLTNFPAFLAHVGAKPSPELSLDRIDNDGNYEPGNVRWATRLEQRHNRRPGYSPVGNYSRLTAADVIAIRARREGGEILRTIAADFGISITLVSSIHKRRNWKRLP